MHTHDLILPQEKLEATSENNAASNHSTGSAASIKKDNEYSEKGSEAQVRPIPPNFVDMLCRMSTSHISVLECETVRKL